MPVDAFDSVISAGSFGNWIYIENCHLYRNIWQNLIDFIISMKNKTQHTHFRLFLNI